jgi:serine/threonine-protein kinase HipA
MNSNREILVYADWHSLGTPQCVGRLFSSYARGKEIFSFEYDKQWLQSSFVQEIDPELGLYSGIQYLRDEKSNFGVFLDSSPDRWGRVLMERRESILARMENRQRKNLNESDCLLGVSDEQRMGALRFKENASGAFLNDNRNFATPPWSSIRELEQASFQLENDLIDDGSEILKWLFMLLAPGSSLGGARPKAGVRNADGALWIAKFPSREDRHDVGAWEMIVNELAKKAEINVAQAMAKPFYGKHHTFLSKRFDRTSAGQRLHFASAMTLLGYTDGINFQEGASYLEMAEFIERKGAKVNQDLEELFRRIVFSICVSNTDDHLRNHGFLLTGKGWILSPAYDVNPNPKGTGLKLNISEYDNSLNLDLAFEVAPFFRLTNDRAAVIIHNTINVVSEWRQLAMKYNLSRDEQEKMSRSFLTRKVAQNNQKLPHG